MASVAVVALVVPAVAEVPAVAVAAAVAEIDGNHKLHTPLE
jgi:hypothetical protein